MVTLQEFSIDSWKTAFLFFMKEMRVKYQTHIFLGKKPTTKYNYSGVSKQESMYNAFEEVIIVFMSNTRNCSFYETNTVLVHYLT